MAEGKNRWIGRQGGCLCGAIRYEITGPPLALTACHCTDCQRRGGGALSLSMPLSEGDVRMVQGTLATTKEQIEDRVKTNHVCDRCHTRLLVTNTGTPGIVIVKAGTLDDCSDLYPVAHVWVRSKQPWVALDPGVLAFETQPDPAAFGSVVEAWKAQEAR